MDFRRIQHFVHIAEMGSMSKAAERLNIVQPALSQSIKRLEEELGVTLFIRSRRGMDVTDQGRAFLVHAYGILNQYNRAKESLSGNGGSPAGLVSIAMTASTLEVLTLPLSESLMRTYPDIRLNIESGLAGNIQHGFEAGRYDIVLSHLVRPDATIHIENLIEEDLYFVTEYDPALTETEIAFDALTGLPLIIPQDQHGVAPDITTYAKAHNIESIPAQVTGALRTTLQLVEAGLGNSILPWSAIHERVAKEHVSARMVVAPEIKHTVCMAYPNHRPLTPATIAIMELIRQATRNVHSKGLWTGKLLVADK